MEPFLANLANYRLPLVVPALFDKQLLTGTLSLRRGALQRAFHFVDGCLVAASSNEPREHLAQVLCTLNILDVARSAAAFEAAQSQQQPFGAFLLERGFVERPRLLEALAHKAREAFFDCYAWESGELELSDGPPPPGALVELKIPLGTLHRDGLARLREWRAFKEVFPHADGTFRVHREMAVDGRSDEEDALLDLAERGATLGEFLALAPEGQLFASRRLLHLYRRGVLSPHRSQHGTSGETRDVAQLMELTRTLLAQGRHEAAAQVAAQALESAPVPEACALYREAELRMALSISDELMSLEGRLAFAPLPRPAPPQVTADDLYVYSLLKSARSIREAMLRAAMGEVAAYRCVRTLVACGLLHVTGSEDRRRRTSPYGIPAVSQ